MIEHVLTLLAHAFVLVGLFSRLTPLKVLRHHGRQRILAVVEARPNVRLHDLQEASGLAQGTLRHHARVLERLGLLRTHSTGRARRFLARSTLDVRGKAAFTLTEEALCREDPLLEVLLRHVGEGSMRLSSGMRFLVVHCGVSRMGAWKAVQRAVAHGLLVRTLVGHRVYVHRPRPAALLNSECAAAAVQGVPVEVAA